MKNKGKVEKEKKSIKEEIKEIIGIQSLNQILTTSNSLRGFKINLFLRKIPKIIRKRTARKMSFDVAKGVVEKALIRIIKYSAGVKS